MLRRFWRHLSRRRQRQFVALTGLVLLSAFAEVVSLSAVLPFIGILTAPDLIFKRPLFASALHAWNITTPPQLVLPLTLLFAATAIAAAAIRTLLLWTSTRLACSAGADVSMQVYWRTLYQPYRVHVARNSSEVISGIVSKAQEVVFGVLQPFMQLISSLVVLIVITIALIVIDPFVNLVAIVGCGTLHVLISRLSRDRLLRNSKRIAHEQTQVIKALQEGLGGIRDVLLDGTQPTYCEIYRAADQPLRLAQGNNFFLSQCPRYAMESLGMVLIAALAYVLSRHPGGIVTGLPVLGTLAIGAQRLLPALQQSHSAWATINGSSAALADTNALLDQQVSPDVLVPVKKPLPFQHSIQFAGVSFRYAENGPWILDDLTVVIPKGARVGLVGTTGSGKSTALDVLMGLLAPTEGQLLVDGQRIESNNVRAWQQTIAHVPQSIYLADTTLTENIAFGVPRPDIDRGRVREAARQAQIADFIEHLPDGYDTLVGERGVRLSGGQRQRIGIARALYKRANVLVFDEATSALDNATEQCVMDAIGALNRNLTVLLVAHRLNTVRRCDVIIELEHGRVVAQGTYDQLLQGSPTFRGMAHTTLIAS
jgi:ATP-binding cassette, subfamily B, bacterial PglK